MDKLFPILYTVKKNGKKQFWSICIENDINYSTIVIKYGILDGKITISKRIINSGKNIGKENETTHFEQAVSEAKSKWNKKKYQDYQEDQEDQEDNKIILPMLAFDYNKRGKDIKTPCYIQPKLDGIRAILNNNKFQSRTGKFFPHLEHILNELKSIKYNLDGELYSYTLPFEDISGIVRKEKLDEKYKNCIHQIIFVVYDIVLPIDYNERYNILIKMFNTKTFKYIKIINNDILYKKEEISKIHKKYVEKGYEGVILRNYEGKYDIKNRSKNLQKYKLFKDDEYKIIDFTDGEGIEKGLVIWICETSSGNVFNVRPRGTHQERKILYKNAHIYINKLLTVKYFELTTKQEDGRGGIPRFPVGISIRDYE